MTYNQATAGAAEVLADATRARDVEDVRLLDIVLCNLNALAAATRVLHPKHAPAIRAIVHQAERTLEARRAVEAALDKARRDDQGALWDGV